MDYWFCQRGDEDIKRNGIFHGAPVYCIYLPAAAEGAAMGAVGGATYSPLRAEAAAAAINCYWPLARWRWGEFLGEVTFIKTAVRLSDFIGKIVTIKTTQEIYTL